MRPKGSEEDSLAKNRETVHEANKSSQVWKIHMCQFTESRTVVQVKNTEGIFCIDTELRLGSRCH